jgi:hypothetical protein
MIGAIKEAELADLIRLKAAETIYDIFLWNEGSFAFIDGEIPQLPMVPISSDVTGLVMEGLRRYDEWQRIKTRITSMRQIPALVVPVEEQLGEREKLILSTINGHRSIDVIALETHNPEFHVAKLVYDLLLSGHVALRGEREDTTAAPAFAEAEVEIDAASAFDPILGASTDAAAPRPSPRVEEFLLSPPGPHTPPPTDFGRFLKRGPDSDATLRGKPRPGDSASAARALTTRPPDVPPPGVSSAFTQAAIPAASRPAVPPAPAPVARGKHPQAPAEPGPKIPPGAVPTLSKPMEELMSFAFTPNEAFIVSRINGMWDVRSIARISPFPEAEVFRVFVKLQSSGVISLK